MPAIEVAGLQRAFSDEVLAVAGIDLQVEEGEIYAFLGPNGAGKTTTVPPPCARRSASPCRRRRSIR